MPKSLEKVRLLLHIDKFVEETNQFISPYHIKFNEAITNLIVTEEETASGYKKLNAENNQRRFQSRRGTGTVSGKRRG